MIRVSLVLVVAVAALISPLAISDASAQLQIWCPAGDGQLFPGPFANRNVDFDRNGVVGLGDFAFFAAGYSSPPQPYTLCRDFNDNGTINLADFAIWGSHYQHAGAFVGVCN